MGLETADQNQLRNLLRTKYSSVGQYLNPVVVHKVKTACQLTLMEPWHFLHDTL